jgi:hypothetical protein
VARPAPTPLAADWSLFDPVAYLSEYYGDLGSENLALLRFLSQVYPELPRGGVLLDFGGGPTIYPLISAVTRVSEIHFCDYLEANLEEVRRWISADPAAFDWSPFIRQALEFEMGTAPTSADVERRAREIRRRVTRLGRCDASRSPALSWTHPPYDVVLTNFCAESATSDRAVGALHGEHRLALAARRMARDVGAQGRHALLRRLPIVPGGRHLGRRPGGGP